MKFKILNLKKMTQAYVCIKISEYPPTHPWDGAVFLTNLRVP